jgi:hypothetical protein
MSGKSNFSTFARAAAAKVKELGIALRGSGALEIQAKLAAGD